MYWWFFMISRIYDRISAVSYAKKWALSRNPKYYNFDTVGDIAQLSFNEISFEHSLIIIKIDDISNLNKIYIASHTFDSLDKKISKYSFKKIRFIHIVDV